MDLTNWWVETHQAPSSAQKMWESWKAPHREEIAVALHCIPDVESVYEIGCGSGPNLRMLKDDYCHKLKLGGSDPCEGMAAWASEHLGLTIDRLTLPDVPTGSWDAVLSCYALAYVEPDGVIKALTDLRQVATYLVLLEPNASLPPYDHCGLYRRGDCLPEWAHDYPRLLRETGWSILWRWPHMPPTDGLNAVIVAEQEPV